MAKHTAAFSSAAGLVVDNSSNAYRAAIELHDQEETSAGVIKVVEGKAWDPDQSAPLISPEGLQTRLQVLEGLKSYAQSLSDVTSGLDSPALTAAATSTGANLKSLGTTIASDPVGSKTGISVGTQTANIVSTAALALGEYLVSRKVKAALPSITRQMDPQIESLCKLLTDDVGRLRRQSNVDYEGLFNQEWAFIQANRDKLTPVELRAEVEKLPAIRKSEHSNDAMLADLVTAIGRLALTHHALAAAAQGNNPEALSARIADLEAAGKNLGDFYQGLATK